MGGIARSMNDIGDADQVGDISPKLVVSVGREGTCFSRFIGRQETACSKAYAIADARARSDTTSSKFPSFQNLHEPIRPWHIHQNGPGRLDLRNLGKEQDRRAKTRSCKLCTIYQGNGRSVDDRLQRQPLADSLAVPLSSLASQLTFAQQL